MEGENTIENQAQNEGVQETTHANEAEDSPQKSPTIAALEAEQEEQEVDKTVIVDSQPSCIIEDKRKLVTKFASQNMHVGEQQSASTMPSTLNTTQPSQEQVQMQQMPVKIEKGEPAQQQQQQLNQQTLPIKKEESQKRRSKEKAQAKQTENNIEDDYDNSDSDQDKVISEFVETSPNGRFKRFDEELGRGAYKTVYRGVDHDTGREIAWSVIRLGTLPKSERPRIKQEIQLIKDLNHKNIITFINAWICKEKEQIHFITEIITGGSLRQYLKKMGKPKLKVIKKWSQEILEGLNYLHSQTVPIIHRDIKCDNIFINSNSGEIKIGDLGLSTSMKNSHTSSVLGTPEFMAPELYEECYDTEVDIYAFGMALLEMLTREAPYRECANIAQIYRKVTNREYPLALSRVKNEQVKNFIILCLGEKSKRPTAKQLLDSEFMKDTTSPINNQPVEIEESNRQKLPKKAKNQIKNPLPEIQEKEDEINVEIDIKTQSRQQTTDVSRQTMTSMQALTQNQSIDNVTINTQIMKPVEEQKHPENLQPQEEHELHEHDSNASQDPDIQNEKLNQTQIYLNQLDEEKNDRLLSIKIELINLPEDSNDYGSPDEAIKYIRAYTSKHEKITGEASNFDIKMSNVDAFAKNEINDNKFKQLSSFKDNSMKVVKQEPKIIEGNVLQQFHEDQAREEMEKKRQNEKVVKKKDEKNQQDFQRQKLAFKEKIESAIHKKPEASQNVTKPISNTMRASEMIQSKVTVTPNLEKKEEKTKATPQESKSTVVQPKQSESKAQNAAQPQPPKPEKTEKVTTDKAPEKQPEKSQQQNPTVVTQDPSKKTEKKDQTKIKMKEVKEFKEDQQSIPSSATIKEGPKVLKAEDNNMKKQSTFEILTPDLKKPPSLKVEQSAQKPPLKSEKDLSTQKRENNHNNTLTENKAHRESTDKQNEKNESQQQRRTIERPDMAVNQSEQKPKQTVKEPNSSQSTIPKEVKPEKQHESKDLKTSFSTQKPPVTPTPPMTKESDKQVQVQGQTLQKKKTQADIGKNENLEWQTVHEKGELAKKRRDSFKQKQNTQPNIKEPDSSNTVKSESHSLKMPHDSSKVKYNEVYQLAIQESQPTELPMDITLKNGVICFYYNLQTDSPEQIFQELIQKEGMQLDNFDHQALSDQINEILNFFNETRAKFLQKQKQSQAVEKTTSSQVNNAAEKQQQAVAKSQVGMHANQQSQQAKHAADSAPKPVKTQQKKDPPAQTHPAPTTEDVDKDKKEKSKPENAHPRLNSNTSQQHQLVTKAPDPVEEMKAKKDEFKNIYRKMNDGIRDFFNLLHSHNVSEDIDVVLNIMEYQKDDGREFKKEFITEMQKIHSKYLQDKKLIKHHNIPDQPKKQNETSGKQPAAKGETSQKQTATQSNQTVKGKTTSKFNIAKAVPKFQLLSKTKKLNLSLQRPTSKDNQDTDKELVIELQNYINIINMAIKVQRKIEIIHNDSNIDLQEALHQVTEVQNDNSDNLKIDGDFGIYTEEQVKKIQEEMNTECDGVVTENTLKKMENYLDRINWLNQIKIDQIIEEHQNANKTSKKVHSPVHQEEEKHDHPTQTTSIQSSVSSDKQQSTSVLTAQFTMASNKFQVIEEAEPFKEEQGSSGGTNPLANRPNAHEEGYEADQTFMTINSKEQEGGDSEPIIKKANETN